MGTWDVEAYCDGCHRGCHLSRPRCGFGAQQAREFEAERAAALAEAPTCPGCHCGCSLADPQCGRGGVFAQRWMDGEEIPQRPPFGKRGPGSGGPQAGGPKPDGRQDHRSDEIDGQGQGPKNPQVGGPRPGGPGPFGPQDDASRLAFLVPIGMRLFDQAMLPMQPGRFLGMLHHQGDWMKMGVLEEKARMNADSLYPMLDQLLAEGCLIKDYDTLYITEAGVQRADWAQEHAAEDNARLFASLDPDELATFADLWQRLMGQWREVAGGEAVAAGKENG